MAHKCQDSQMAILMKQMKEDKLKAVKIYNFVAPIFHDSELIEIRNTMDTVYGMLQADFRPFRTLGEAMAYKRRAKNGN